MDRNALHRLRVLGADGGEFEAAHLMERFGEIAELRREVVVNEKHFHRRVCPNARQKGAAGTPAEPNKELSRRAAYVRAIRPTAGPSGRSSCGRRRIRSPRC